MPHYIYSTLSCDTVYTDDAPAPEKSVGQTRPDRVLVKGGTEAGNKQPVTPMGVATEVSDEEMTLLQQSEIFNLHRANGFIRIAPVETNPEAAPDVPSKDKPAPLDRRYLDAGHEPINNTAPKEKESKVKKKPEAGSGEL